MIEIKRVTTKGELKQFVQFYYDLYRGDEHAVPHLFFDEMATLDRERNPSFECCEADYFLALKDGKTAGRVAAIINRRANERWDCRQVRFGWLDFIDDQEVCAALMKTVEDWGRERGMTEMIGPMGFIDTDREGMLVDGFDQVATMYINYNHPYYPRLVEGTGGMEKANDWVEYMVKVPGKVPEKFAKVNEMVRRRYNLKIHKFTRNELIKEGKARELFKLLNETYRNLYGFSELSDRQIEKLVNDYIKLADLNLVTGVLDGNAGDRLVGFGITFPSFSKALQKTRDGRLFPFGWWHLLKILKWHKTPIVDLLLIGVLPEYRAKGANALIFDDLIHWFQRYGFEWAETGPMMETNEGVLSQWQYFEKSFIHRRHRCYKKRLA